MKTDLWKQIEQVLEYWGEWISESVNSGYPSKNPLTECMEYGIRVGARTDIVPHYDIDKRNQKTHRALLAAELIDTRLYAVGYFESAWHHESDPGAPRGRRKLKAGQIAEKMGISKKSFYILKGNLYAYLLGKLDF